MSINAVLISGNLGSDPEIRTTQSGISVMSFNVAVNERVKGSDGNWNDRVNWIPCTMFGARAEAVSRYIGKGSKVAIEGKLRWSQWQQDGNKRSKIEVVVDEIEFMSQRQEQQPQQQDPYYSEDIPF